MNGGQAAPDRGTVVTLEDLVAQGGRGLSLAAPRHRLPTPATPGPHQRGKVSRGMEYQESRPYQQGDDRRSLDWRQSARRGSLYTRLYAEEQGRPVRFLVDLSASMRFGTKVAFKSVIAARAAAWLAWRIGARGDRVGGVAWNGPGAAELPPCSKRGGILSLLAALAQAGGPGSPGLPGFMDALGTLAGRSDKAALTVVLSDFAGLAPASAGALARLADRGQLLLVEVFDPLEAAPPAGNYALWDGDRQWPMNDPGARAAYAGLRARRLELLQAQARHLRAGLVSLSTAADLARTLGPAIELLPGPSA